MTEQRRLRIPDLKQAHTNLREVEQAIATAMDAIKRGILTERTKASLEQAEAERVRLLQALQGEHKALDKVVNFLPDMVGKFNSLVGDLATVPQRQVEKARGIFKELVGGQSMLHPSSDGAEHFLTAELSGDYAGRVQLVCSQRVNLTTEDP